MSNTFIHWGGIIEELINFGRDDKSSSFKIVNKNNSIYDNFTHFSHVMVFCRTNQVFETFNKKAIILMQMRFDGYIGFPGGIVDKGETPLEAVCREVKEELGWQEENGAVKETDYQFTHVDEKKKKVYHFYATEISENKMNFIEKNMMLAADYGNEVLGNFRVPLYTMGDGFQGFPAFLRNHFIGNAKLQLIESVIKVKLLNEEEVMQALHSAPLIT